MARTRRVSDAGDAPEEACAASSASPADGGPEPAAGPPPGPTEIVGPAEHYAGHLRDSTSSMFHFAAMAPAFKGIDMPAYRIYRDRLLADCGNPSDPIEVMIVEQLSLAHFSLGLLSCKAANAVKVEAVGVYSGAAARLMGEFRRSALALQAYRAASRQLAHDPTRDLVIGAGGADPPDHLPGRNGADGELIATTEFTDAGESILPYPRPEALGDQPPQPPEVARHEPRGKGPGPRRGANAPAVGAVHGAAHG